MTLPASGPISLADINGEFGLGYNLNAYRGVTWYTDAGATGTFPTTNLSFSDFYNKRATAPAFTVNVVSNQQNLNVYSYALGQGWNGVLPLIVNIYAYVYSDSTGSPGMTVSGSFPNGLTINNYASIMGKGGSGAGAINGTAQGVVAGASGGAAISLGASCTIYNYGYIGGGGGGGGAYYYQDGGGGFAGPIASGGGGAGGGDGGYARQWDYTLTAVAGGSGGGTGSSGANGSVISGLPWNNCVATAGGGGRIMPGTTSNFANCTAPYQVGFGPGGQAGGGGAAFTVSGSSATGGAGEGGNSAGIAGTASSFAYGGGGGGGYGASGGSGATGAAFPAALAPGAGGKAVALNGYFVTWGAGYSNVYGAVS